MPSIEISREDAEALRAGIQSYLGDLHDEIVHTDGYDFKTMLQQRRARLEDFLRRLEALG
jgi:hypothetical protein